MKFGCEGFPNCESLLGLDNRLIDRLRPVPSPEVAADGCEVTISWKCDDGFTGGQINFFGAERIESDGSSFTGDTKMVVSNIYINPNYDINYTERRNPREGLVCVLTMIATLNRAALINKGEILHVVRANERSTPYFRRFVSSGIYYYCDHHGNRENQPITVCGGNWILFACQYPVQGLDEVLGKHVVENASRALAVTYPSKKRVELSPKLPFFSKSHPFFQP